MTPMTPDVPAICAKMKEPERKALIDARAYDDGEVYARPYSVRDMLTKSYAVYGRGDPLNRIGLAVRAHLLKEQQP